MKNRTDILEALKEVIAGETGLPVSEIADDASFYSLGLDSISCVYVLDVLEKRLKLDMDPTVFWDHPTVSLLAGHLTALSIRT